MNYESNFVVPYLFKEYSFQVKTRKSKNDKVKSYDIELFNGFIRQQMKSDEFFTNKNNFYSYTNCTAIQKRKNEEFDITKKYFLEKITRFFQITTTAKEYLFLIDTYGIHKNHKFSMKNISYLDLLQKIKNVQTKIENFAKDNSYEFGKFTYDIYEYGYKKYEFFNLKLSVKNFFCHRLGSLVRKRGENYTNEYYFYFFFRFEYRI